jgi:hypothetical protein
MAWRVRGDWNWWLGSVNIDSKSKDRTNTNGGGQECPVHTQKKGSAIALPLIVSRHFSVPSGLLHLREL